MPPRVAILPPVPVPYREPLFRALAERGNVVPHVTYLAARQPDWDQPESWFSDAEGYRSEILRSWQRGRPGLTPITLPRGLGRALTAAEPDCVVSSEYGPATMRALAWARRRGVPVVIVSELTPWSDAGLSSLQRRVHRALAPRAAGFIVVSSQGAARLRRMGVDPARVEVALQNADLGHIRPAAPATNGGPVRVLAVGRLVPMKNLDGLIRAFAEAGFEDGEAELDVRGIGPLAGELQALAHELGVPARFPGAATPEELGEVYAEAHALALVSSYEPFGVTLREGAAAGLPLIASERAGATGDVAVAGENALVVDPDDRMSLVEALRRIVREPELRERLAAGSRAVTERHPPEADVEAWERAILRAVSSARPDGLRAPGRAPTGT
ncbi:MAG TPA: glycosyltransferase family 4 protein [Thermoleophilaceae bacterium]|nr:glycosyltransferase family 4 protein [Thermoleophilaceae bacterium]